MRCATASRPIFSIAALISESSRRCSKQRHTAHEHPIEGRIYYPFHPWCGETVLIIKQYAYRGTNLVVIPQPGRIGRLHPRMDDARIGCAA
jgi:hypothetical protein